MSPTRFSGTARGSLCFSRMTQPSEVQPIVDPMTPEAVDGYVEAVDPPETKMKMTPDAAEISAIRLLDAAAKARE